MARARVCAVCVCADSGVRSKTWRTGVWARGMGRRLDVSVLGRAGWYVIADVVLFLGMSVRELANCRFCVSCERCLVLTALCCSVWIGPQGPRPCRQLGSNPPKKAQRRTINYIVVPEDILRLVDYCWR